MNTFLGNATRPPQARRSSVPPCRPHTPCLGARSAGISFALRLPARISALVADRFAWLSPRLRPGGSTHHLAVDTLPSSHLPTRGRRVMPGLLSTHPPARVRRDFHPQEKRPAGRTARIG